MHGEEVEKKELYISGTERAGDVSEEILPFACMFVRADARQTRQSFSSPPAPTSTAAPSSNGNCIMRS